MNCKSALEMLSAYLDRELAPQERDAMRVHLASCDGCRSEERELRALKGLLLGVRAPEPAPDFERRLMDGIREESVKPVRAPLLPRLSLHTWTQVGSFGGLAVAGALAFLVINVNRTPHAPAAEPPRTTVATNVADYEALADGYEVYSRAAEFTGGADLLTKDAP